METIQALRSLKESLEDTKHAQLEAERGGNLEKAPNKSTVDYRNSKRK